LFGKTVPHIVGIGKNTVLCTTPVFLSAEVENDFGGKNRKPSEQKKNIFHTGKSGN
jgi:hypothetical protein